MLNGGDGSLGFKISDAPLEYITTPVIKDNKITQISFTDGGASANRTTKTCMAVPEPPAEGAFVLTSTNGVLS